MLFSIDFNVFVVNVNCVVNVNNFTQLSTTINAYIHWQIYIYLYVTHTKITTKVIRTNVKTSLLSFRCVYIFHILTPSIVFFRFVFTDFLVTDRFDFSMRRFFLLTKRFHFSNCILWVGCKGSKRHINRTYLRRSYTCVKLSCTLYIVKLWISQTAIQDTTANL